MTHYDAIITWSRGLIRSSRSPLICSTMELYSSNDVSTSSSGSKDFVVINREPGPQSDQDRNQLAANQFEALVADNKTLREAFQRHSDALKQRMYEMKELKEKQEASLAQQASQIETAKSTIAALKSKNEELKALLMVQKAENQKAKTGEVRREKYIYDSKS